ncbi:MAG TPA: gluconate 2-dehydrogenase subunit 3 family protein [Chitinophagaceae bacterium]|nr:gluconate 2-dehydrogenase subunit 3 family protein [Chitinophagaceae bacterium]
MERRELLKLIALATGSALIGGEMFLTGCKNGPKLGGTAFTENDIAFLDEVGETILPKTQTPGAKETEIGKFMKVMVDDCYDEDDQKTFHAGIAKLDEACEAMHKTSFMKATPEQRLQLLQSLDTEAKEYQKKKGEFEKAQNEKEKEEKAKGNTAFKKERMEPHYFTMMKQLTITGYFTSKPGATKALRYMPVPGKYDGAFPYKKGDKAWAS